MQKDFHFYITYALAVKTDLPTRDAEIIAWADQYTDELNKHLKPDLGDDFVNAASGHLSEAVKDFPKFPQGGTCG